MSLKDLDLENNAKELLSSTVQLQADLKKSRIATNEKYRSEESEEYNLFRITLDGLIARCIKQLGKKMEKTDEKISYQISLIISFVRTHFIINDLILEGDLIEAFTLMRKNLESFTRLNEIDQKPLLKLQRKTPNVINVLGKTGKKLYPTLSEIAHFATPNVGSLLTVKESEDGRTGPSLFPIYNTESIKCYDRHAFISINFIYYLIEFLKKNYGKEYDYKADIATFLMIGTSAQDLGMIERNDESTKDNNV